VPRTEGTLRRTLDPSRAPTAGWTVTLRVVRLNGALQAEGEITDPTRAPVAHRIFTEATTECASLARAVGVWASIVLDTELDRAQAASPPLPQPPPPPALAPHPPTVVGVAEKSPDRDTDPSRVAETHEVDLGATTYLMGGMGTSAMVGVSVFPMIQANDMLFMRPALSYGRAVRGADGTTDVPASWAAARFDVCGRIIGAYLDSRALQLDLCLGPEVGFVHVNVPSTAGVMSTFSADLPTIDLGPSIALRGDLNTFLSLEMRGYGFVNAARQSIVAQGVFVQPSVFGGRVEVAFAWKIR
jgi:hypothetical protein